MTEEELKLRYAAVFHLVTAAKGAEEFYTYANNAARYESVSQAVVMDDRLIECWGGHPHLYIIDNSVELREKLKKLIAQIRDFLGEPAPAEIEISLTCTLYPLGRPLRLASSDRRR
jgi:hypothetical protein